MRTPRAIAASALAIVALGLAAAGCGGGGDTVNAVTVGPDGVAQGEIHVGIGDPFTVTLQVSPEQAKKGVASWARDYDAATPLATEGPSETKGSAKDGFTAVFNFTGAASGSADMGFRQIAQQVTGATPLRQTATVHVTVD